MARMPNPIQDDFTGESHLSPASRRRPPRGAQPRGLPKSTPVPSDPVYLKIPAPRVRVWQYPQAHVPRSFRRRARREPRGPQDLAGNSDLAALFLDALWPVFLLFGIERAEITPRSNSFLLLDFTFYPSSHTLPPAL